MDGFVDAPAVLVVAAAVPLLTLLVVAGVVLATVAPVVPAALGFEFDDTWLALLLIEALICGCCCCMDDVVVMGVVFGSAWGIVLAA